MAPPAASVVSAGEDRRPLPLPVDSTARGDQGQLVTEGVKG